MKIEIIKGKMVKLIPEKIVRKFLSNRDNVIIYSHWSSKDNKVFPCFLLSMERRSGDMLDSYIFDIKKIGNEYSLDYQESWDEGEYLDQVFSHCSFPFIQRYNYFGVYNREISFPEYFLYKYDNLEYIR